MFYAELIQTPPQSTWIDTKQFRCTTRAVYPSVGYSQNVAQVHGYRFVKLHGNFRLSNLISFSLDGKQRIKCQPTSPVQYQLTFHQVLQLTDIARPRIINQSFQSARHNPGSGGKTQ